MRHRRTLSAVFTCFNPSENEGDMCFDGEHAIRLRSGLHKKSLQFPATRSKSVNRANGARSDPSNATSGPFPGERNRR